jgi:hypothetical protein
MKKSIFLSALLFFSFQFDSSAQVDAAGALKSKARGVAGRPAPPKTGQPGVAGGGGVGAGSYRPAPTRIPDRTKTPIRQIESAISYVKFKKPLTDVHREKLATGMVAAGEASGAKVKPESITKVAYEVANAVNRHKPGYSGQKRLAAALLAAMGAANFDADQIKFTVGEARHAFSETKATPAELESIAAGLKSLIGEQKQTVSK